MRYAEGQYAERQCVMQKACVATLEVVRLGFAAGRVD